MAIAIRYGMVWYGMVQQAALTQTKNRAFTLIDDAPYDICSYSLVLFVSLSNFYSNSSWYSVYIKRQLLQYVFIMKVLTKCRKYGNCNYITTIHWYGVAYVSRSNDDKRCMHWIQIRADGRWSFFSLLLLLLWLQLHYCCIQQQLI